MSTVVGAISVPKAPEKPVLTRSVTWKSAFVVSLGAALLIVTSLGSIAGDLRWHQCSPIKVVEHPHTHMKPLKNGRLLGLWQTGDIG